jgi:AraC family transcriptional activator of pobA
MTSDLSILKKYNEAFLKFQNEGIIDLDKKQLPKLNFAVYRLEERLKELGGVVPTNRESNYYIAFIKKGKGTKTIGLSKFPIVDHTLMVIPARAIHGGEYTSSDYCGYVLGFSLDYFMSNHFPRHLITDKLIFKKSLRPHVVLRQAEGQSIQLIFEDLLRESLRSNRAGGLDEMVALKILELVINCDRIFAENQLTGLPATYPEIIERFNNLVEQHFTREHSVKFYAGALNMHQNTLNTIVRKHTGNSPKDAITSKLAMEARYYLTHSSLSIKEIAHRLGFEDPNYFSYFFRKSWKCSASEITRLKAG